MLSNAFDVSLDSTNERHFKVFCYNMLRLATCYIISFLLNTFTYFQDNGNYYASIT